jgi:hypothetical protein
VTQNLYAKNKTKKTYARVPPLNGFMHLSHGMQITSILSLSWYPQNSGPQTWLFITNIEKSILKYKFLPLKKNPVICDKMDRTRKQYVKWNKPGTEKDKYACFHKYIKAKNVDLKGVRKGRGPKPYHPDSSRFHLMAEAKQGRVWLYLDGRRRGG